MEDLVKTICIEKDASHQVLDMAYSHAHPYHELYFLISGERRYLIGHKIYDVLPGNIVIVPQTALHRTTALNNKGYERYVVYFLEKEIRPFIASLGQDAFDQFLESGCLQFPQECVRHIQHNLQLMAQEQKKNDSLSPHIMLNLLQNTILTAIRYGERKNVECGKSINKLQSVMLYISEHYDSEISLQDAADMAFMERTYFSRCFKRYTGFGFSEYLNRIRLLAAERLLQYTDLSISDISDRCGFSGSNYFSGVFKQSHGISPTEYRKQSGHVL